MEKYSIVPRMGIIRWIGLVCTLLTQSLWAQNVAKVEYFVDTDPGFGQATNVPVSAGTDLTQSFSVNVNNLAAGFHRLYVRSWTAPYDLVNGKPTKGGWSLTTSRTFYKEILTQQEVVPNVVKLEYFVDEDPGFGKAANVPVTPGKDLANVVFNVNVAALGAGFHKLYVRAMNAQGKWGTTTIRTFYKEVITQQETAPVLVKVEYFVDEDPGFGKATNVAITPGKDLTNVVFNTNVNALPAGFHKLYVRARDVNGKWSLTSHRTFYKEVINQSETAPDLVKGEYFIDEDPGFGKGTGIPLTAAKELTNLVFALNMAAISVGNHQLYVRFQDAKGKWGLTNSHPFKVEPPSELFVTLGSITGSPFCAGGTVGVPITVNAPFGSNNVFTAQLSDSRGNFSNPVAIGTLKSSSAGTINATLPAYGPGLGSSTYRIRVLASSPNDTSGVSTPLTIQTVPAAAAISGNSVVCTGSELYRVDTTAGTSYVWKLNAAGSTDTTTLATAPTATINWTTAGAYYVTVIPSNRCGQGTASQLYVRVDGAKPAQIPAIQRSNDGTYLAVSNPTLSYQWYKDGVKIASNANTNLPLQGDGTYTARFYNVCGEGPESNAISISGDKISQVVSLDSIPGKTFGDAPFVLQASASSGLPITFGVSGPATISGTTLTLTGAGTVLVTASQAGNETYNAASTSRSFVVKKKAATVTLSNLLQTYNGTAKLPTVVTNPAGLSVALTFDGVPGSVINAKSYLVVATINDPNHAGLVSDTFTIQKATQTLAVEAISNKVYGQEPFEVTATASSGLPVALSIASQPAGIANLSGETIILTSATGSVTLTASQAGNANYLAAPSVSQTFQVNKASQSIEFGTLANKDKTDPPFTVSASASSGLPVSFAWVAGPASVSSEGLVTLTGQEGQVVIRAFQNGNANYEPAAEVTRSFSVTSATQSQTISFATIPAKTFGDAPLVLQASASSGLPVTFTLLSGPATLTDNLLTLTGAGEVRLRATQAGNEAYTAAPSVEQLLIVNKANQALAFGVLPDKTQGDTPFTLRATASSGLPVSFSLVSGPATVQDSILTLTGGTGTVVVQASQVGNGNYNAATPVQRSFRVLPVATAPDIAVQSVTASPTELAPGDVVTVAWKVANVGTAPSSVDWTERIYIQSVNGQNRTLLKQTVFTKATGLPTGQSISRSDDVTIPAEPTVGDGGVFVVELLPGSSIVEAPGSEANNTGIQATPWTIRKVLTLELSATQLTEGASAGTTVVVKRAGALTAPLTVQVALQQPKRFSFPLSVTIPAGQAGTSFTILALENDLVEGTVTDSVRVSAANFQEAKARIWVLDNDSPALFITQLPTEVTEGETVRFRVTTDLASNLPLQVFLSSVNQARFPVPPSVTLPAGALSADVTVKLEQDNVPEVDLDVAITAGAANRQPANATVLVKDDDVPGLELLVETNIVAESAGLYATKATLRRTKNSNALAFTAAISADLPNTLLLPATLSLAAGENEKTFTIGTIDNTLADGDRQVTLTAAIFVASCGCSAPPSSSGSVSAEMTVTDNDGPALQLTATPLTLPEGAASAGLLRVSRNTPANAALTVTLASSNTSEATVPATAVIPVGQAFVEVPITTLDDGVTDGGQQVYFQATASGFSTGSVWVLVSDQNKPDLQVAAVKLSSSAVQASEVVTYQFLVKNTGFAAAPTGVLVRGYLSKDAVLDDKDSLLTEDVVNVPIGVGASVPVVNAVQTPNLPGDYALIFKVNPQASLTELLLTNNTSEAVALRIKPDYTATAAVALPYFLKGKAIPVTGSATRSDGTPAANTNVEVYVITNGLRRTVMTTTNATGAFTASFVPLAAEGGHYSLGASFPGLGATAEQDKFDILSVRINGGTVPQLKVVLQDTLKGELTIQNLSNTPLTNFTLQPVNLPNGATIQFDAIASLAGNATRTLAYIVVGKVLSSGNSFEVANLQAVAKEGIIQMADAFYFCQAPNAYVVADIAKIDVSASQSKGERLLEFRLVNKGVGASGEIKISLPQFNWLSSVTPKTLPSLATGDTAVVVLKFQASAEVPFNYPIVGSIGVGIPNGNSFSLPFTFEKVSETVGTVKVTVSNQFTYYSDGAPKVKDAHVTVKNYFSGEVYADGYTDASGVFSVAGVPEGKHRIIVEKEKHLAYNSTITINPGGLTETSVFLNYQAITFSWSVVPTAVQDQYDITLVTEFETHVPMPVVTIDMPKNMPQLSGSETYAFNVTLTNHGLITAKDVTLNLPQNDPEYEFVTNYAPSDLLAQQSIQVPVLMQRRSSSLAANPSGGPSVAAISQFLGMDQSQYRSVARQSLPCQDFTGVVYWYKCNLSTGLWQQGGVLFSYSGRACGGSEGTGDGILIGGGQFPYNGNGIYYNLPCYFCVVGGIGPSGVPPVYTNEKKSCVECINDIIGAAAGCGTGGLSGAVGAVSCAFGAVLGGDGLGGLVECIPLPLPPPISCAMGIAGAINTCANTSVGSARSGTQRVPAAALTKTLNQKSEPELGAVFKQISENLQVVIDAYQARQDWANEYFGDLTKSDAFLDLAPRIEPFIIALDSIPLLAQSAILSAMQGFEIQPAALQAFFNRWNTSVHARSQGVMEPTTQYPAIINWNQVKGYSDVMVAQSNIAKELGYESLNEMFDKENEALNEVLDGQKNAVCASVKVQISQKLTMTREAFEGTLDIFNGHPTDAMDSLSVQIEIKDADGVPSNGVFEIQTKSLTHLSDITGTGAIDAQQNGTVKFLFIPELGAAPTEPKEYNFGGYVRYWDPYARAMVILPLASVPLTVNPSPNLMLHYFMERNILGDDALTSPEIEPTIPAELAVMVENQGYGPAVNMTISSAQPKIIENEKGLAINFSIIGSNFQGKPRNLGITDIDFGTIPPLQTRVGQWYFTSSLLGKFVSYEASVVHANSFGNPELSLVKGVKLHELTKSIRLYGDQEDGINDFLVNDLFDVHDEPDILYHSQGNQTDKVYPAKASRFSAPVAAPSFTNLLTVMPSDTGWNYTKLNDPGDRKYELVSVTRSDGQVIPLDNAWLTFVTLPVSRPPVYENKFHFVDNFPSLDSVSYTLVWKPKDLNGPEVVRIDGIPGQITAEQVKNVTVTFSKSIDPATFTYEDLNLTFQGGPNLMDSSVVITPLDPATFLVNLSALTTGNGFYNLTVQAAQVQDSDGIKGSVGKQATWSQFLTVPTVQAFYGIPEGNTASSFDTIQVLFNLPIDVATASPERFVLLKDSVPQSGALTIDSVRADKKLFYLSGLKNLLTGSGTYELVVDLPNIQSVEGVAGMTPQSIQLIVDNTGPMASLATSSRGGLDAQHVTFVDIQFDESVKGFNTASLTLTRNGEVLPLNIAQLANTDGKNWSAGNFGLLTYPEGDYTFTLNLAGFTDAIGNVGTGSKQLSWTVDRSATLTLSDLAIGPDLGFSDSDAITSGLAQVVSFTLSDAAVQVTISQQDISGELILKQVANVAAGAVSIPVSLVTGGNTGIKLTATGVNGGIGIAEKTFFLDLVPLSAQWLLPANQTLKTQLDSVSLSFNSKLLSDQALLSAVQFRRNETALSTDSLRIELVNDTTYRIDGLRAASSLAGNYQLTFELASFSKYSSGMGGTGVISVAWTVQSTNQAPVAKAGKDLVATSPGVVQLDGSASYDPDSDLITYHWVAQEGIQLSDSLTAKPSFSVTASDQGKTYSFLLVVRDGSLFSTDVVKVKVELDKTTQAITFNALPNATFGDAPFLLNASASSGLPIAYRVAGPATLSGNLLTLTGIGTVTVTAQQAGNKQYLPAENVLQSFQVGKATAIVTLSGLEYGFDGKPKNATFTTIPIGLKVLLTYENLATPPTNAGRYAVKAAVLDSNYVGSASATLVISKAAPLLSWNTPLDIVSGTPLGASQLSAVANTPGSYAYQPELGTVLPAGANQTLTVLFTPTDQANYLPASASVKINVLANAPVLVNCSATGRILREVWTQVGGSAIAAIPGTQLPSFTSYPTQLDLPNEGTNYAERLRGYLCPPVSGEYRFWLASDDAGELYLSANEEPANKVRIALVTEHTGNKEWKKYASQRSVLINLVAGKKYYLEVLHKQGVSGSNLAVAWSLPGSSATANPVVVDGQYLSPFLPELANLPPKVSLSSPVQDFSYLVTSPVPLAALASDVYGQVTQVEFLVDGVPVGADDQEPYELMWQPTTTGPYLISARATDNAGVSTTSASLTIQVKSSLPVLVNCSATGRILREVWTQVGGSTLAAIPLTQLPTFTSYPTQLDLLNEGTNYAERLRGYLCPPVSGEYRFWLASDDAGELYLSANEEPANKVRIASVTEHTGNKEWKKYASQRSVLINLVAGKKYYLEVLHKQGVSGSNLSVAWSLPGSSATANPVVVDGQYLSPFLPELANLPPKVNLVGPANGASTVVYTAVKLQAIASDLYGSISKVEFYANGEKVGEDGTEPYTADWVPTLAGSFSLTAQATDNQGATTTSASITFGVLAKPLVLVNCSATGTILREVWTQVNGSTIADIPLPVAPSSIGYLTNLEIENNTVANTATRIRGYVCPPVSGEYTFFLASDDAGELYLSANDDPARKVRIASVNDHTHVKEWKKDPSQQSPSIWLVAGKKYYLEVLNKQGRGTAHLAVSWLMPGSPILANPTVVPGSYLSPYALPNARMQTEETRQLPQLQLEARPIPFHEYLTIDFRSPYPDKLALQLYDMRGVFLRTLYEGVVEAGSWQSVLLQGATIPEGMYLLKLKTKKEAIYKKVVFLR